MTTLRVFSHTASNTEIVCALGAGHLLIGVDDDSDYPPEIVANLPRCGRDLDLRVADVLALRPDLVLTSLTVPGHERIVAAFEAAGVPTLICDPLGLDDVYRDIARIAEAVALPQRGAQLISEMQAAIEGSGQHAFTTYRPRVLIEWWPKPVIAPARQAWATDLIVQAGGSNPWAVIDAKSAPLTDAQIFVTPPEVIVMSWCGVKAENYRAEIVRRRPGWGGVPAVINDRIVGISEAFLGRPGPRLVEGYRLLRQAIDTCR